MTVSKLVRLVVLTAVAGFTAACGESPTAPAAERSGGLLPPYDAAASMGPNFLLGTNGSDIQTTISVDPNQTAFYPVGAHWVYIPKGAVCRLDSSYGMGEWDKDCVSETNRVTIPVTVGERNGHALITFGTDIRFKPASDPHKGVYLWMREPSLNVSKYSVLWQGADGQWVNEAIADKSLRAFRVNGLWIGRRVKHFSGYNVSLGIYEEQGDPTVPGGAQ